MYSGDAKTRSSAPNYVELGRLGIKTPTGWSNNPNDLNIDLYFADGEVIASELKDLCHNNCLPIITNRKDSYFLQADNSRGTQHYFQWNAISGMLMMVTENITLEGLMDKVKYSVLSIKMRLVATT